MAIWSASWKPCFQGKKEPNWYWYTSEQPQGDSTEYPDDVETLAQQVVAELAEAVQEVHHPPNPRSSLQRR